MSQLGRHQPGHYSRRLLQQNLPIADL